MNAKFGTHDLERFFAHWNLRVYLTLNNFFLSTSRRDATASPDIKMEHTNNDGKEYFLKFNFMQLFFYFLSFLMRIGYLQIRNKIILSLFGPLSRQLLQK